MNKRKLFVVFNRAIAKARKAQESAKIIQRLYKALGILQHHDYYVAEKALYHPTTFSCGCDDWKYRNAAKRQYRGFCKHVIAEILLERVSLITYQQRTFFDLYK